MDSMLEEIAREGIQVKGKNISELLISFQEKTNFTGMSDHNNILYLKTNKSMKDSCIEDGLGFCRNNPYTTGIVDPSVRMVFCKFD